MSVEGTPMYIVHILIHLLSMPQLYNQGGDGITAGDKYVSATNNQAAFLSGVCVVMQEETGLRTHSRLLCIMSVVDFLSAFPHELTHGPACTDLPIICHRGQPQLPRELSARCFLHLPPRNKLGRRDRFRHARCGMGRGVLLFLLPFGVPLPYQLPDKGAAVYPPSDVQMTMCIG